jgi:hypothetical protein
MTDIVLEKSKVRVYDPTAEGPRENDALAPRRPSLDHVTIGLLDNTKDMVGVLLDEVQTLLKKDFPDVEFRYFRKESVSGAAAGLMEQVAQCNAVVTAIGD